MQFKVANDARPQVQLLLLAAVISLGLWFIPFASWLVYPLNLFVTFIHEGSHALAAVLTGASVASLSVAPDGSGMVMSASNSWLSQVITSSAGYIGAVGFGALLLVLIRLGVRPNIILFGSSALVAILTVAFGILAPAWNVFSITPSVFGIGFTLIAGAFISTMLLLGARFAQGWWANFIVSFLAVQCLLNAFFDLKNLFYVSSMSPGTHSDAMNMANYTGIPSIAWVFIWLLVSVLITGLALRVYSISRSVKAPTVDSAFDARGI
jgi:hypothetical protein